MRALFATCTAVLLLLGGAPPAIACFDVDAPPAATIRFTSSTSAELIVTGLVVQTGALNAGDYCAAYQLNTTVSPTCLATAARKFSQAFARTESPGLCDAGNAAPVATLVDDFVSNGTSGGGDLIPPP